MSLHGKALEEIVQVDLEALVDNQVRESQTLDYKRDPYGRGDEEVREMLRDISSMANAFGGDLLIGVDESEEGVAVDLPGVENAKVEAQRIVSSSLDNIEERIFGLRAWPVPLQNSRHVIVVRIPRSPRAPHMFTFKGLNQFWARHDTQKSRMSVREIRDVCLKIEGLMEKLEGFLQKRKHEILQDVGTLPYYAISVTPIFVDTEVVDIRDTKLRNLLKNPSDYRPERYTAGFEHAPVHPTLGGIARESPGLKYLELFHNGHLELRVSIKMDFFYQYKFPGKDRDHPILGPYPLCEYPLSLIRLGKDVYKYLGIIDPVVVSLSLFNIIQFALTGVADPSRMAPIPDFSPQVWMKQHLEIPPRQFPSLNEPDIVTKECVDRIWHAFHYEQAPLFDEQEHFRR